MYSHIGGAWFFFSLHRSLSILPYVGSKRQPGSPTPDRDSPNSVSRKSRIAASLQFILSPVLVQYNKSWLNEK